MTRYRPAVAWTHIVLGGLTLLPAFILPLVFGGVWSLVTLGADDPQASAILGVTFGVVLMVVLSVLAISGGLSLAAGIGLLRKKPWGDVLTIIASVLHIANVPIGTLVGALSLWVLLIREPRNRRSMPQAESI
ncbi:MAG: hypothetical protein Q8N23_24870 [Archangium sp.]|nr:hypothetical protein [Archangium sp.]MDP3155929.1 hypothetical protein [Archangium sp.]MDP3576175.1 hypothetical protein [Archangium sp.]